jgi:hypothetical protein
MATKYKIVEDAFGAPAQVPLAAKLIRKFTTPRFDPPKVTPKVTTPRLGVPWGYTGPPARTPPCSQPSKCTVYWLGVQP